MLAIKHEYDYVDGMDSMDKSGTVSQGLNIPLPVPVSVTRLPDLHH